MAKKKKIKKIRKRAYHPLDNLFLLLWLMNILLFYYLGVHFIQLNGWRFHVEYWGNAVLAVVIYNVGVGLAHWLVRLADKEKHPPL